LADSAPPTVLQMHPGHDAPPDGHGWPQRTTDAPAGRIRIRPDRRTRRTALVRLRQPSTVLRRATRAAARWMPPCRLMRCPDVPRGTRLAGQGTRHATPCQRARWRAALPLVFAGRWWRSARPQHPRPSCPALPSPLGWLAGGRRALVLTRGAPPPGSGFRASRRAVVAALLVAPLRASILGAPPANSGRFPFLYAHSGGAKPAPPAPPQRASPWHASRYGKARAGACPRPTATIGGRALLGRSLSSLRAGGH